MNMMNRYQVSQYHPQLGQTSTVDTVKNNAIPFILGALTWAVFGNLFKQSFGLGEAVTSRGISAVRSKVEKKSSTSARPRLPPPSGSR